MVVAFQNGGDVFPNRLGHFSREGMKPSPALGTLFAEIPQGYAGFNDLGGLADGTSFEERLHSVAETAIKKGISK